MLIVPRTIMCTPAASATPTEATALGAATAQPRT